MPEDELLTDLDALATPSSDDLLYIVDDPAGTPLDKKITYGNLTAGLAPINAEYVVLTADGALTDERVLTGTANQIVITDNGSGGTVVLSTPQDIHAAAAPTFAGLTLNGAAVLNTGAAATIGLIVKGAASQSANLQEWQNSVGAVLAGVDERGILFSDGGIDVNSVFIGSNAGKAGATGTQNVAVGANTLVNLTTGSHNFALGKSALNLNTTGSYNVAIGSVALRNNLVGGNNVGLGFYALRSNVANQNIGVGSHALENNTSGTENIGIGYRAGRLTTIGGQNISIGAVALYSNISGSGNIVFGDHAGFCHTGSNTLIIDNRQRADIATELTNSILYGVMAAVPANQTLRINAAVNLSIGIQDATDIPLGTTTGTKIGTATNQKLAFHNATPIVQQTGVAVTAAGIHAALVNLGLIAA